MKQTQWFCIALGLLTIFYAILYCVFLYTTLVRVPVWDLLDWVVLYLQTGRTGDWWSYLWQPHNEHRIPISRLLLAVDIEIFRGSGIPFLIFGALSQLAIVGILIREIRLSSQATELRLVAIAAVIFAFAASHLAILVSMTVLGVFLQTTLFVILAITFLDGENENRHSVLRRSLAIACAALAPFGVSAGLLVWPVMLWAAWRGNLGPKWSVLIALVGIAEWIIYLRGISVTPHKLISAAEIVNMLDYSVRFLGLPWSHAPSLVWFGRLAGLTWFAVGSWLLVTLSLQKPALGRLQRIGAALILFTLSTAAAAGIARLGVVPDREMPIRYSIFVATGQIGILFAASGYLIFFFGILRDERLSHWSSSRLSFLLPSRLLRALPPPQSRKNMFRSGNSFVQDAGRRKWKPMCTPRRLAQNLLCNYFEKRISIRLELWNCLHAIASDPQLPMQ